MADEIEERVNELAAADGRYCVWTWDDRRWLIAQVRTHRKRVAKLEGALESALNTGGLRFGEDSLTRSVRGKILRALPEYVDPYAGTTGALRAVEEGERAPMTPPEERP